MRVVLSNGSWAWGGVHTVTEALLRGLQARGHEVVVFGRPDSPLEERLAPLAPFEGIVQGMDLSPLAVARCARALRRHRAQVALMLMKKDVRLTGPAGLLTGVPVVVRHANDRPIPGGPYGRLLYGRIPALHVANSAATRATVLASAPYLPPERVAVVHNGVDPEPFASAPPAALGLPVDALVIAFLGRFDLRKGLVELARAWPRVAAAVPSAHLVLVGKGPAEEEVRALLADAPRVLWAGFRQDVAAVLRASHLVAMPSHWEGFGLVAAEALAAGVPVVASSASSLPEIVGDGAQGLLVPPRDAEALAAALIRLAHDPGLRARMGAAGQARVRAEFSLERMVDRYAALLQRVAEERR